MAELTEPDYYSAISHFQTGTRLIFSLDTKAAKLRKTAEIHGWLDTRLNPPDNKELSEVLEHNANLPQQTSSVEPFAKEVKEWVQQGVSNIKENAPPEVSVMLDHEPGDTAQVDFGSGPVILRISQSLSRCRSHTFSGGSSRPLFPFHR